MRTDHHSGASTLRRAARRKVPALLAAIAALALLGASGAMAANRDFKHACDVAPAPGHAACLALRLLSAPQSSAGASAQARRAQSVTNNKPYPGFLTPQRLHEAYGLPEETALGATQTIAVVDAFDDPTAEADLAVYDKQFGLAPCTSENGCFEKVNEQGQTSPLPEAEGGWASEISIDVQMARAICQSCHILLVEADSEEFSDLGAAVNTAVKAGAEEISNSYGGTETASYESLASNDYDHPGVLVAASSGDCGYDNKLCAKDTPGANFPADYPDVLSVGGTSMIEKSGVWTSTAWEEGGSGCSALFSAPLWQSEVGDFSATGCGSKRAIADVSAIGDPNTGVDVYDSTPEEPGAPTGWGVWGGTSVAAPIVASEFALAGGAEGVSYPAQTLYEHAGQESAFYDVTSGSNGTCSSTSICNARAGYDGPTGLGSPVGLEAFAVSGAPESTKAPSVEGTPEQGQTLSARRGSWSGEPTSSSLQWERCSTQGLACTAIAGATGSTYTAGSADVGLTLRVRETVRNGVGTGSAYSAVVGPVASDVPTIGTLSPSSGITGSTFVVEGTALDTTSAVLVDKLAASFVVLSPTRLQVTVPDGAATGKVQVNTAHGSVTSKAKFTTTLSIRSFEPTSAATGSAVTIKGIGFDASSTVAFDGTAATSVTYLSKTKLKATVPAGIGSGPITVTNTAAPAGTVSSAGDFTP